MAREVGRGRQRPARPGMLGRTLELLRDALVRLIGAEREMPGPLLGLGWRGRKAQMHGLSVAGSDARVGFCRQQRVAEANESGSIDRHHRRADGLVQPHPRHGLAEGCNQNLSCRPRECRRMGDDMGGPLGQSLQAVPH